MEYVYDEKALPSVELEKHPEWEDMYKSAWRMAFKNVRHPSTPGWKPYMGALNDSANIWVCDSNFMVFFTRYSGGTLPSITDLDNFYRLQREDGYISMAYTPEPEREAYPGRIMMPIFAWTEWEYYNLSGDSSRFEKVVPVLVKYFNWIKRNRRRPNGLYWYEDSGSSGLDNSPRGGYPSLNQDGSDICFVDLACQQALSAMHISKMAEFLGDSQTAERFSAEYSELSGLINRRHWCARYGFYYDLNYKSSETGDYYLNHKTVASFWPLLCGAADSDTWKQRKMTEHLLDPGEFWTMNPVPGLSKDDPNYDPMGNYHCGSVWSNMDYMVASGLKRCGLKYLAREVAVRHLSTVEKVWNDPAWGNIWEAYSPEYYRPASSARGGVVRPNNVGCTGLVPISMLIEFVIGLDYDARKNMVSWNISEKGRHAIKNLGFNGQKIALTAEALDISKPGRIVKVENEEEFLLDVCSEGIKIPDQKRVYRLKPGRHELKVS